MAITTPIKIEFSEDFDIKLEEIAVGSTPGKALSKTISLGTGLFGRTILEITDDKNLYAFVDNAQIDGKLDIGFEKATIRQ